MKQPLLYKLVTDGYSAKFSAMSSDNVWETVLYAETQAQSEQLMLTIRALACAKLAFNGSNVLYYTSIGKHHK